MSYTHHYVTETEYAQGAENGISRSTVYNRVYSLGWDVERAITEPVQQKNRHGRWLAVALENGLTKDQFYNHISKRGMTAEEAATTPFVKRKPVRKAPIVTPELIEQAAQNGIGEATLRARIYNYRWSLERAATEKLKHRQPARTKEWNKFGEKEG